LLKEACDIATLISPDRIAADMCLDLMYGSAGTILSLLLLDRELKRLEVGSASLLEQAVACGEHLLRNQSGGPEEPGSWSYRGGLPRCGLAHGASGISYALALLAKRTGREDFLRAASEGLRFERRFYVPEEGNWRSSADLDRPSLVAWCNGAPGIALSRLRLALTGLADEELESDLARALATTREAPESPLDFLCCGNIGRAEILLEVARRLGRPDLLDRAEEIAERVAGRLYLPLSDPPSGADYRPSLFWGVAGIGYVFLRLVVPSLPCVLTLE